MSGQSDSEMRTITEAKEGVCGVVNGSRDPMLHHSKEGTTATRLVDHLKEGSTASKQRRSAGMEGCADGQRSPVEGRLEAEQLLLEKLGDRLSGQNSNGGGRVSEDRVTQAAGPGSMPAGSISNPHGSISNTKVSITAGSNPHGSGHPESTIHGSVRNGGDSTVRTNENGTYDSIIDCDTRRTDSVCDNTPDLDCDGEVHKNDISINTFNDTELKSSSNNTPEGRGDCSIGQGQSESGKREVDTGSSRSKLGSVELRRAGYQSQPVSSSLPYESTTTLSETQCRTVSLDNHTDLESVSNPGGDVRVDPRSSGSTLEDIISELDHIGRMLSIPDASDLPPSPPSTLPPSSALKSSSVVSVACRGASTSTTGGFDSPNEPPCHSALSLLDVDSSLNKKRYDRRSVTSVSSESRLIGQSNCSPTAAVSVAGSRSSEKIGTRAPVTNQRAAFPGIVRTSRSQETYFDSFEAMMTCVDIDVDDNIVSSIDALHYDATSSFASLAEGLGDWARGRAVPGLVEERGGVGGWVPSGDWEGEDDEGLFEDGEKCDDDDVIISNDDNIDNDDVVGDVNNDDINDDVDDNDVDDASVDITINSASNKSAVDEISPTEDQVKGEGVSVNRSQSLMKKALMELQSFNKAVVAASSQSAVSKHTVVATSHSSSAIKGNGTAQDEGRKPALVRRTVSLDSNSNTRPEALRSAAIGLKPGHAVPITEQDGEVLFSRGNTESEVLLGSGSSETNRRASASSVTSQLSSSSSSAQPVTITSQQRSISSINSSLSYIAPYRSIFSQDSKPPPLPLGDQLDTTLPDLTPDLPVLDSEEGGFERGLVPPLSPLSAPREVDRESAARLAKRLYHLHGFKKCDVARHLCKKNSFAQLVSEEYLKYFEFRDEPLTAALRRFIKHLILCNETQDRERLLSHFATRYHTCNPTTYKSQDACHTLSCAILLLHNDLHGPNMGRRMTLSEFITNLSEMNDGENFPRDVLKTLYQSIKTQPLEIEVIGENGELCQMVGQCSNSVIGQQSVLNNQSRAGTVGLGVASYANVLSHVTEPECTVEYKKGYVMRKCCVEPEGRKTPLGRRGWKMYYATLRDMILYLHTDEHGLKRSSGSAAHLGNVLRVHHSLATKATDYLKKSHVFRLQTADMAQYLIQTSDSKECQEWIDAINFVAASYSAPCQPPPPESQRHLQRHVLPHTYTTLNLREQIGQHELMVVQCDRELLEHRKNPPEKGARTRLIQLYVRKENYLKFEYKMSAFPELEPSLAEIAIGEVDEPISSSSSLASLTDEHNTNTCHPPITPQPPNLAGSAPLANTSLVTARASEITGVSGFSGSSNTGYGTVAGATVAGDVARVDTDTMVTKHCDTSLSLSSSSSSNVVNTSSSHVRGEGEGLKGPSALRRWSDKGPSILGGPGSMLGGPGSLPPSKSGTSLPPSPSRTTARSAFDRY